MKVLITAHQEEVEDGKLCKDLLQWHFLELEKGNERGSAGG